MPDWIIPTLTFIGGAGLTWVMLRVRFERFEAMDTRREKDWSAWREDVDERLHRLNGALLERLDRLEEDIGTHDTGLRGAVHKLMNAQLIMDGRVSALEQRARRSRITNERRDDE